MKKVLILCYDYPPLKTIGALRPFSWMRHFPDFDLYPIVVARRWEDDIHTQADKLVPKHTEDKEEITEHGATYLVAQPPSRRSKLIAKHGLEGAHYRRSALTAQEIVFGPFWLRFDETAFLYRKAEQVVNQHKPDYIIATGRPFRLFHYAHLLSHKHNIPWIADYRDSWLKNHTLNSKPLLDRLTKRHQRKWTSSCSGFTTVSEPLRKQITEMIDKPGTVIMNGVELEDMPPPATVSDDRFELLFCGTVYPSSYVDVLLEGLNRFIKETGATPDQFGMHFVGSLVTTTAGTQRLMAISGELKPFIHLEEALEHKDTLIRQTQATALLNLIPGNAAKGIYSGKIFEYLCSGRPIITIESEEPESPSTFYPEHLNYCYTAEAFMEALKRMYQAHQSGNLKGSLLSETERNKLSRKTQAGNLAALLKQLT